MGLGLGLAGGLAAAAASRPAAPKPMYTPKQEPSYAYNPPPPKPAPPQSLPPDATTQAQYKGIAVQYDESGNNPYVVEPDSGAEGGFRYTPLKQSDITNVAGRFVYGQEAPTFFQAF